MNNYCRFCKDKELVGGHWQFSKYRCEGCPYSYLLLNNGGDSWNFRTIKYEVDVYSYWSYIYTHDIYENIRAYKLPCQLLPDTTDADIDLYLAFM